MCPSVMARACINASTDTSREVTVLGNQQVLSQVPFNIWNELPNEIVHMVLEHLLHIDDLYVHTSGTSLPHVTRHSSWTVYRQLRFPTQDNWLVGILRAGSSVFDAALPILLRNNKLQIFGSEIFYFGSSFGSSPMAKFVTDLRIDSPRTGSYEDMTDLIEPVMALPKLEKLVFGMWPLKSYGMADVLDSTDHYYVTVTGSMKCLLEHPVLKWCRIIQWIERARRRRLARIQRINAAWADVFDTLLSRPEAEGKDFMYDVRCSQDRQGAYGGLRDVNYSVSEYYRASDETCGRD